MSNYCVYVLELDDAAGPRRRPDRPNLYVGITSMDPEKKLERIKTSPSGTSTSATTSSA